MSTRKKALFLLLSATFIWGVSSPINRHALASIPPWPFAAFRYMFASLALLPLVLRWGRRQAPAQYFDHPVERLVWLKAGLCLGALLALGTWLQFMGLAVTTASKSGFITSLYISMVAVYGFVFGQLPRWQVWAGLGLCLAGLVFIGNPGDANGFNRGDALTLVADLVWAAHLIVMGHFAQKVNPWRLVASQSGVCSLICFGMAAATDSMCTSEEFRTAFPAIIWAVCSVSLAYVCQALAQINTPATTAAITLQFQPVIGATCGVLFLNEPLTMPLVIGAALLVSGALVAQRAEDPVRLTRANPRFKILRAAQVAAAVLLLTACGLSMLLTGPGAG
ncbi:MAG: DMT family transporter [Deltaproteobacteria bacterium]|jgi:drug/metabolite transporter (DMT)-like permease|nr:DMT family transporter [Deltaproteobacteria bacterium]